MAEPRQESVEALRLSLHGHSVGVLVHYSGGKNILTFDPSYANAVPDGRVILTLTQIKAPEFLEKPLMNSQRLPPLLSNLLPEGFLRSWMASALKVDTTNEFPMLAWAGGDLPGALIANPLPPGEIPAWALSSREQVEPIQIPVGVTAQKFSLAGVQMKFSSVFQDGRFNIGQTDGHESWIIKTPSTLHKGVPQNEYTMMRLAEAIGVNIPDIKLIPLSDLKDLPEIQLPNESEAYAIRRYDRSEQGRIHAEDFAQIFGIYAHNKYKNANYEMIAAALYQVGSEGLTDIQQMARRLLANILLANGDAHLKNWSVYYPDRHSPRLSPAYDIVSTLPYVSGERAVALNMNKIKAWHQIDMDVFKAWAKRIDVSWSAVRVHLNDAIDQARDQWPTRLKDLPMLEQHKKILKEHWSRLVNDFKII